MPVKNGHQTWKKGYTIVNHQSYIVLLLRMFEFGERSSQTLKRDFCEVLGDHTCEFLQVRAEHNSQ